MGSFLGAALGPVAGGIASIIGGALSNSANRHAATVANQRNVYNYQHRYQWAMDDMQKAGLNPMLAATQGIGGSINGASALSANYNIGEGVTAGMSASAAGSSAKAAQKQADTAQRVGEGTIKKLDSDVVLNAATAKNFEAEAAGKTLANKLATDTYADNVALYKQNLENAKKQGLLIDEQTKNAIYQRDVVMPAQANMMIAQGNAANSSASYSSQLSAQSAEATARAKSQNEMRQRYGFDTDSGFIGALGGFAANILNRGKAFFDELEAGKHNFRKW
nr:MAG TPA: DNA pilot protein [Microviridae sp.]